MPEDSPISSPGPDLASDAAPAELVNLVNRRAPELEGDYRPAAGTYLDPVNARVEAADCVFRMTKSRAQELENGSGLN